MPRQSLKPLKLEKPPLCQQWPKKCVEMCEVVFIDLCKALDSYPKGFKDQEHELKTRQYNSVLGSKFVCGAPPKG